MEDKTKIKTTPTSIYQQPLENNRKIYQTALTTNNQWKTKQKQKQHQVFTNSHQKTTEK